MLSGPLNVSVVKPILEYLSRYQISDNSSWGAQITVRYPLIMRETLHVITPATVYLSAYANLECDISKPHVRKFVFTN